LRVTSALWVAAYVRRCHAQGAFAIVARHGADEAGAIFIIVDRLGDAVDLYGPAPQTSFDEARPSDRLFQRLIDNQPMEAVTARLDRERGFDPDLWVVAVEDRDARVFFETVG
jgi:hypothetical protein